MATTEQTHRFKGARGLWRTDGQSRQPFQLLLDGATSNTLLAEPVPVVQSSLPSAGTGSTGCVPTENYPCARVVFGGTAAANTLTHYQVVLWYPGPVISGADELTYIPVIVAKGTARLGASTYTTDDMGAAANLFADTIVDERGADGVFVHSPEDDSKAWLDIDVHNATGIEIEVARTTATTVDVMVQFGEMPANALRGPVGAQDMALIIDGSTNVDTALADPVPAAALPALYSAATGGTSGAVLTNGAEFATLNFGGSGDADKDFAYQVVLWKEARTISGANALAFIPELVASGVAKLGARTYTVDDIGATANKFADTVTETVGHELTVLRSPANDTMASLYVDVRNYVAIEVEIDRDAGSDAATNCDVWLQLGDTPAPFESTGLVGAINDTTTDSLHGKIGTDTELGDQSLYDRIGAYTGPAAGAEADDNIKAALDIVDTNVDTLTTNLALVSGYTQYDGWRVASKTITANPGTTPGTVLFTLTATVSTVVELQVFGVVSVGITGTLAETLAIKTEDGTELIAATTATALTAGLLWYDIDPDVSVEPSSSAPTYLFACPFANSTILLEQSGEDGWDTGQLVIYCRWRPIHASGSVTAS